MRQPPQPPQGSSAPTSSGSAGNGPATPYGVVPDRQASSSPSPYAAFAPGASPRSGQQADYPYLHHGQTAVPTQPVAQHLSAVGQPASRIVTDRTGADPYSTGPTASFPRFVPSLSPSPAPTTPRQPAQPSVAGAAPPGVTHEAVFSPPAPWRRDRVIALITTLIACGTQVVWTLIDGSRQPSFRAAPGFTLDFVIQLVFYILLTPGAWWLFLQFSSIKAIYENRPTPVMVAATLQVLLIDVLMFNDSITGTPLPILCLLATGGAAIAATIMSQHTPTARSRLVTLGLAANLFILVAALHQLTSSLRYALNGANLSERTINLWMTPASGPEYRGAPLIGGIILMIVTAVIAATCLYLGSQHRHTMAFARLVGLAPLIMALTNVYILLAHGLSATSIGSTLGLTSIGKEFPYIYFRAWGTSILLGVFAVGETVLLHRRASARRRETGQVMPVAATVQPPLRQSYRPYTR